jgi:lipid-A-disaccharide synthase
MGLCLDYIVFQGVDRLVGRKIYMIAGEASGDLHGAALVKELKALDPGLQLRGWGGDLMEQAGCQVSKHYRDLAFMGFVEVVRNLRTIRANFDLVKEDILNFKPDLVIFIDYPGFNMRVLPWVRRKGIRTVYYIAPQAWAWHRSRVHTLRRHLDKLLVILPFEEAFFRKHGVNATWVGHPLIDAVDRFRNRCGRS